MNSRCSCGAPKSPNAKHCMKCREGGKLSRVQQEAIVARLRAGGVTTYALAAEYGLSHQGVSYLARKFGVELKGRSGPAPVLRPHYCEECGARVGRRNKRCQPCWLRKLAKLNVGKRTRDLTGQRFGKLVALRPSPTRRYGYVEWFCKCDCGNETLVALGPLTKGTVRSCGCLRRENHRARGGKK